MRLRAPSKGHSRLRGNKPSHSPLRKPQPNAAEAKAASTGSPMVCPCSSASALLHKQAARIAKWALSGRELPSSVDPQPHGLHQASVRGHPVSGLQQHQVARNQLAARHFGHATRPPDPGFGHDQVAKGKHRPLCAILLQETERGVEGDHDTHRHRLLGVAQQPRNHRGSEKHCDQRTLELREQYAHRARTGGLRQRIGPHGTDASGGFGWMQPLLKVGAQVPGGFLRRKGVARQLRGRPGSFCG